MKKPLTIRISGEPIAQGRPRLGMVRGRPVAFDPQKSRDYKEFVSLTTQQSVDDQEWEYTDKPVTLSISAYFPVPKSKSKRFREQALAKKIPHSSKPDIDNVIKAFLDGVVRGGAIKDDNQVVEIVAHKYYGEPPCILATLSLWEDTNE